MFDVQRFIVLPVCAPASQRGQPSSRGGKREASRTRRNVFGGCERTWCVHEKEIPCETQIPCAPFDLLNISCGKLFSVHFSCYGLSPARLFLHFAFTFLIPFGARGKSALHALAVLSSPAAALPASTSRWLFRVAPAGSPRAVRFYLPARSHLHVLGSVVVGGRTMAERRFACWPLILYSFAYICLCCPPNLAVCLAVCETRPLPLRGSCPARRSSVEMLPAARLSTLAPSRSHV